MAKQSVFFLVCLFISGSAVAQTATPSVSVSGHVVDASDKPISGARVFCEPGIAASLLETRSDQDGAYAFPNVSADNIGVFAMADGFAFGGATVDPALPATDVRIELAAPATLTGTVVDPKKHPIPGAHITRVGLLGRTKVGIPLGKLAALGLPEPVSDGEGRFTVPNLPQNGVVALKIFHTDFAQEALNDTPVGGDGVRVTMYTGVRLEGTVVSRASGQAVAGVNVMVRNAQPPHDTATVLSNASGTFSLRLKPGVYACQAVAPAFRSAGWTTLTLTGEDPAPTTKVFVAGVGQIKGKVCDAASSQPVAGARIVLNTQGNMAAVARTNASGEFVLQAMAGQNEIKLDSAPGYRAPEQPALTVKVAENGVTELPVFWVVAIPSHAVLVVDETGMCVPDAVVTVLRPEQFGWRTTDAQGQVKLEFASLPPDGTIVGLVEHRTKPLGALFSLRRDDTQTAKVQLLPTGRVTGRVAADKGLGLEGVVIGAMLGDSDCPVWRTVTGPDGTFELSAVVPQVSLRCAAYGSADLSGNSESFSLSGAESKDVGTITLPETAKRASCRGKALEWYSNRLIAGTLPERKALRGQPAVVLYCTAAEAAMYVEGVATAQTLLQPSSVLFAVVVDGAYETRSAAIPVLSGRAPATAKTYVIDQDGKVVLETFGLPSLRSLSALVR